MSLLVADNIAVSFGGVKAVQDVSFAVELGEVFSIVGPNGAGKTTIFNLISSKCEHSMLPSPARTQSRNAP